MYQIVFYRNRKGIEPVYELLCQLRRNNNKDSRIKLNKIQDYIQALSVYGTNLPEKYLKHLQNDIWELRPVRYRILFAKTKEGYVLLHWFLKKTQKTPKRELEQAEKEYIDFLERSFDHE